MGYSKNNKIATFGVSMFPRIKDFQALDNYKLKILFDDGKKVLYDVNEDIEAIDAFKSLKTEIGLWNSVQLDQSRTCIYWNDTIDIASDTIYEYGLTCE